jgi:hypothetical protein
MVIDAQIVHQIDDMDKFYETMGYTHEMQLQGVLAEEFIWEEYVSSSAPLTACYQKHIIEYMLKNSPSFKEKYGEQCASWIADHANARVVSRKFCKKCNINEFCPS